MADLFKDKAQDWDGRTIPQQISMGVGSTILEKVVLRSDMQVMDFGAGTGLISSHVAPKVASITAVDISESMLEKLAAKPELQGKVETVCQDITQQPLPQQFDLIMSAMAMHHVEDTQQLMQTLLAHLKPGGKVALADLDKEDGTFHPQDVEGVFHHGFEREQLKALMEQCGFSEVEYVTAHTVDKEGKMYPIFLLTACKH